MNSESQNSTDGVKNSWDTRTALCFTLPDGEAKDAVQKIRSKHDKAYHRWMPHINVFFPFVDSTVFDAAIERVSKVVAEQPPIEMRMNGFKAFKGKRSWQVYLAPDEDAVEKLQQLVAKLDSAFKGTKTLAGQNRVKNPGAAGFVPHLSVGQWNPRQAQKEMDKLNKNWVPFAWTVDSLDIVARTGRDDPMTVQAKVNFGGKQNEESKES